MVYVPYTIHDRQIQRVRSGYDNNDRKVKYKRTGNLKKIGTLI